MDTLPSKDFRAITSLFDEDVYDALQLQTCVNGRKVYGGPGARRAWTQQIELIEDFIASSFGAAAGAQA